MAQEKLNGTTYDIIPYEDLYDEVKINTINIELQNENLKLKKDIKEGQTTIETLRKSLEDAQIKNLSESQLELINIYKPQKSNLLLPGFTVVLLFAINIITTLGTIKNKIASILPFGTQYLNIVLFAVLLISIIDILLKRLRYVKIQEISHEIVSPQIIKRFHDSYIKENTEYYRSRKYFTESDVSSFIRSNYCNRRYSKSLAYYMEGLFVVNSHKSINNLKNIFIDNLIAKKMIDIGASKDLDREFYLKS